MKISIVTVCLNAEATIADTLRSVREQDYNNVEHLIVDGGSTDHTIDVIRRHGKGVAALVSEPDRGIYDAMNKGIAMASGDVIGILNADDFYHDERVLSLVATHFSQKQVDAIYADLIVIDPADKKRIIRYYRAHSFSLDKFAYGWMPPHPTFFVRKECYEKFGMYKIDYQIAADYELLIRFLAVRGVSFSYLPKVMVTMRQGGVSSRSLKSNWILNREIVQACRENGIQTNLLKVLSKYPKKLFELIHKPR